MYLLDVEFTTLPSFPSFLLSGALEGEATHPSFFGLSGFVDPNVLVFAKRA